MMPHSSLLFPLLLGIIGAVLYGASGGAAGQPGFDALAAFPIAELTQGITILLAAKFFGWPLKTISIGKIAALSALFGGSHLLFLIAAGLAPIGPVVALHMSAPIVLLLWQVVRKERSLGGQEVTVLLLLMAGILLAVPESGAYAENPPLGLALALVSVIPFAMAMHFITEWGRDQDLRAAAAWRSLLIVPFTMPLLFFADFSTNWIIWYAVLGVMVAPATMMVWWAASKLPVTVTTSVQLSEAWWAALTGVIFFHQSLALSSAISICLILTAAWIETRRHRELPLIDPGLPEAHAVIPQKDLSG
jgi:drug/metabolite transporter (DMT)-like permease